MTKAERTRDGAQMISTCVAVQSSEFKPQYVLPKKTVKEIREPSMVARSRVRTVV
jgi:hypothetical protein